MDFKQTVLNYMLMETYIALGMFGMSLLFVVIMVVIKEKEKARMYMTIIIIVTMVLAVVVLWHGMSTSHARNIQGILREGANLGW